MTAWQLLGAARRRWFIVVVGLIVTAANVVMTKPESAYWATLAVKVLPPADEITPKTLEDTGSDPVAAAVMLVVLVNGGHQDPRSSSATATLYGEGKRRATVARIRDVGGQWGTQVREPIIDIQAVDASPGIVESRLREQMSILEEKLTQMQDMLRVTPSQRLRLALSSSEVNVWQVSGSRVRGLWSSVVIGAVLTMFVVYWVETLSRRARAGRLADT